MADSTLPLALAGLRAGLWPWGPNFQQGLGEAIVLLHCFLFGLVLALGLCRQWQYCGETTAVAKHFVIKGIVSIKFAVFGLKTVHNLFCLIRFRT